MTTTSKLTPGQISVKTFADISLEETVSATFTDNNPGDVAGNFAAVINWGDGTTSTGTVTGGDGAFTVTGTHVYPDGIAPPVAVTITGTADGNVAPTNLQYFLAIDGLDGGSTDPAHAGWFNVSDYAIGPIVAAATAGHPSFAPLTVILPPTGMTSVLTALAYGPAFGDAFKSVELEGVTADGTVAYDLLLGDVTLTSLTDTPSGERLTLGYKKVWLTTTAINPDGSPGSSQNFSWNLTLAQTLDGPNAIATPVPSTTGGDVAPTNLKYFLLINGLDGGSTDAAHAGWFDVSDYAISGIAAAAAGFGTFYPLTVKLPSTGVTGVLAGLVKGSAFGTPFQSVELQGVTANGTVAYDLLLGDVTVTEQSDSPSGDELTLSYNQVWLTTTAINPDGSPGSSQNFSWNLTLAQTLDGRADIPTPVPSVTGGNIAPTHL